MLPQARGHLSPFATDPASELNVLWHNSNPLSMDGAEISVLKKPNQVRFRSLLESSNSGALEAEIGLEVLGDFAHQPLERKLAD